LQRYRYNLHHQLSSEINIHVFPNLEMFFHPVPLPLTQIIML